MVVSSVNDAPILFVQDMGARGPEMALKANDTADAIRRFDSLIRRHVANEILTPLPSIRAQRLG